MLAVAVLRTVRHVLRIGQDVRSILVGLLHRRPPPWACCTDAGVIFLLLNPVLQPRLGLRPRPVRQLDFRLALQSAPEEAGIEASGNRRLPASQELQPDESGFVEVIEVEQEEMVLEGTPVVPQSVVAGRPIEIADEEVVLEGTPLVPLGPSLWYVHETQRRGSVHTHGQLYVPYSRMPRSFLTVHDPLDWPEVD